MQQPPLIVHAIHHLIIGGLENGLVNLINHMPRDRFRHAILCMDYYSEFRDRLKHEDVEIYAMHCKPGRDPVIYWRLWRLFKELKPAIVHSRNLSGLDTLVPATVAGVRCRIHGEHGWYDSDPDGSKIKYQMLRRLHRPFVSHYVALSKDLEGYLHGRIGVSKDRISRLYNGVDLETFRPGEPDPQLLNDAFSSSKFSKLYIGWVGRFQKIKDPMNLARAFVRLLRESPEFKKSVRLIMIGEGSERKTVADYLADSGVGDCVWLPGARDDVAEILRQLDIFVLPSRGEGISNTILEAMASGLPVIATCVGGNEELVIDGQTGALVPHSDPQALASVLADYARDPVMRQDHGVAGRQRATQVFSLQAMTTNYVNLYTEALNRSLKR